MPDKEMLVKDAKSDEMVYFHIRRFGDSFALFDQHGRKLGGAVSVQVTNEVNKIVTAMVKIELVSPMASQSKPRDATAVYSSVTAQRGEY